MTDDCLTQGCPLPPPRRTNDGGASPFIATFSEPFGPLYPASAKSTAGYDEQPVLPGHGEPGPDCGVPVPYHCNNCGASYFVESSCMMRECPNCMEKWASREARFASWRMWTGAKLVARTGGEPERARAEQTMTWEDYIKRETEDPTRGWGWRDCRVLHVVISVPDTRQGIEVSRKQALAVAKKHNLSGGLMVYHPFRQDDDHQFVLDGFVHYHLIALVHGDVPPGGTDGRVLFKVIKDAEYGNYRGFRDPTGIRRVVHYLLSHCGIIEGRHALTWWGTLSYNKLPDQFLKDSYPDAWLAIHEIRRCCPVCGSSDTEPCEIWDNTVWHYRRVPLHPPPTPT